MQMIACPRCSKALPAGAGFCRRCGMNLQPSGERLMPFQAGRGDGRDGGGYAPVGQPPLAGRGPIVAVAVVVACGLMAGIVGGVLRTTRARPAAPVAARATLPPLKPLPRPNVPSARPQPPPLPPLPAWKRHLPDDLPAAGAVPADRDFRGQLLTQDGFEQKALSGAVFAGAALSQVRFEKADLRGADFRGADLSQTTLAGADLTGARFDGAKFSQCHFASVDTAAVVDRTRVVNGITERVPPPPLLPKGVGRASFRAARFNQVDLDDLDLAGADFRGAELSTVGFERADLRGADLREARVTYADFRGAKLDGADLRGADLASAQNLTAEQLAAARTDETTRLPR